MDEKIKTIKELILELMNRMNLVDARREQLIVIKNSSYRNYNDSELHEFIASCQVGALFSILSKLGYWSDGRGEIRGIDGKKMKHKIREGPIDYSEELTTMDDLTIVIDYDTKGRIIGVEIMGVDL